MVKDPAVLYRIERPVRRLGGRRSNGDGAYCHFFLCFLNRGEHGATIRTLLSAAGHTLLMWAAGQFIEMTIVGILAALKGWGCWGYRCISRWRCWLAF